MENGDIEVSIVCTAYNHGAYVESALKGFVSQETDFQYEVIISDDASTDNTREIIEQYHEQYPDIIKPVLFDTNQYSKGVSICDDVLFPMCNGKYIALCEGDDYWIDTKKLQKQFDLLEKYKDINICSHGAAIFDMQMNKINGEICPRSDTGIIDVTEVISGGGGFVATNSLFFRKEIVTIMVPFRKNFYYDYGVQINGSLPNGMYYIGEIMSVYRTNVKGSWTSHFKSDRKARADTMLSIVEMLKELNNYTDGDYEKTIFKEVRNNMFEYYQYSNQNRECLKPEYKKNIKALSVKGKFVFYFKVLFPSFVSILEKRCG